MLSEMRVRIEPGDITEDLPVDQSRQLAFVASSLISIMYLYDSRASPSLPAQRSAWHRFWFAVCHRDFRSHPKSWTIQAVQHKNAFGCKISTYHHQVIVLRIN